MRSLFARLATGLLLSSAVLVVTPTAAQAMSHTDKQMVDTDTPTYHGYNRKLKAYHFRVTGRWRPACGGNYCWGVFYPGDSNHNLGSDDAVRIRFSDAVQFKKFRIRTYDSCGNKKYGKSKKFTSDSFENAYAAVNDEVFASWQKTVWNGDIIKNSGTCKQSTLPTSSYGAGGAGGSGGTTYWANLKGRTYQFDVWINPAPSQGRCYDRLYVKGGYTHTWSSDGLAWSVGYPWGVGVGPVSGSKDFTVYQGNDGFSDPDLVSPRLCRH